MVLNRQKLHYIHPDLAPEYNNSKPDLLRGRLSCLRVSPDPFIQHRLLQQADEAHVVPLGVEAPYLAPGDHQCLGLEK